MAKRALIIPFTARSSPLIITTGQPSGLPNGQAGVAYASAVATSGGSQPATWVANSGTSAWITLSSGGNVTGTPPTSGPATLNATATDQLGAHVSGSWSFTIAPAVTPSGPNPIGANMDYGSFGSTRGLAFSQDGILQSRGFTLPGALSTPVALTASGWPAADFGCILIEGQRVQSWMIGTWKCGFSGTGLETITKNGACTVAKTSALGNPNVTFDLTTTGIAAGQIVGNYALGFVVTNTGLDYSGSMTAALLNVGDQDNGYQNGIGGSINPAQDFQANQILQLHAFNSGGVAPYFLQLVINKANLGANYFNTLTLPSLGQTYSSASATYNGNFGGAGQSAWNWQSPVQSGFAQFAAGTTYPVTLGLVGSGGATGVYAYIPAYGANAAANKHQTTPLWTNEMVALYGQMASIRYMQATGVIGNNSTCTSANRNTPSNTVTINGSPGTLENWCQEYFASMSSACAARHWMNIPIGADDSYYASALAAVAPFMNFAGGTGNCPELIVEISNELWNGAGAGESGGLNTLANAYNVANPGVLNWDGTVNQVTISYRYLALRLHDLTVAAQTQFGAVNVSVNGPVRISFMTQAAAGGWATFIPTVLNFLERQYAGSANQWVHALGADTYTYRNNTSIPGDGTNWEGTSAAPATIQAEWQRNAQYGAFIHYNEGIKLWCLKYGMRFYSYEGVGPGRLDGGDPDNSVAAVGLAIQDPGMNATTVYLAQQKFNAGWDLLVNYSSGINTSNGATVPTYDWDILDTSLLANGSPRFQGLQSFASGAASTHRNQISTTNLSFPATEYADNTAAMSATNPILTNFSGSGLLGPYEVAWLFQVTAANTYNISMAYTGSGTVNVYIDSVEVATAVSVPSGGGTVQLVANQALANGFHSLEIGTGSFQNITVQSFTFTNNVGRLPGASNFTYLGAFAAPAGFAAVNLGQAAGAGSLGLGPVDDNGKQTLYIGSFGAVASMGAMEIPAGPYYLGSGDPNVTATVAKISGVTMTPSSAINTYITANTTQNEGANGVRLSSVYYDAPNNRVIIGYFWYYPGAQAPRACTYNAISLDPTLSTTLSPVFDMQIGTSTLGGNPIDGSQYAGGWGPIAPNWQVTLGGTTLSAIGTLAITNVRTSWGPPLNVFTPTNLVKGTPLATKLISMYGNPGDSNPSQGIDSFTNAGWTYGGIPLNANVNGLGGQAAFNAVPTNNYWSLASGEIIACAFAPANYRTIVVVGTHCQGIYNYGSGTGATPANNGQVQTIATFTATIANGSSTLTGITGVVGTINAGDAICRLDTNGFYVQTAGMDLGGALTKAGTYNAGAQTLTLTNATNTSFPSGTFSFCTNTGDVFAYDPVNTQVKGAVGYPFAFWLWLYDINDALNVSTYGGTLQPYQITPYAVVPLPNPPNVAAGNAPSVGSVNGYGCFDPSTNRLYLVIGATTVGVHPMIGVWQLS